MVIFVASYRVRMYCILYAALATLSEQSERVFLGELGDYPPRLCSPTLLSAAANSGMFVAFFAVSS